jgi:MFS family permease
MDTSTVGVALRAIQDDLSMTESSLQWLVSGYTIAYGGFLLLGGRVADLIGRRKVFVIAMAAFVVASAVGGMVSSPALVIATRIVKGVAAAFTAPAAFAIITTTFPEGPARNKALGVYGSTAATGYSIGLVASGFLTGVSWRLVFFVPGVLALAVLLLTPLAIPRDATGTRERRSYDPGGAILGTSAILLLVYTLVRAPEFGWTAPSTLVSLAVTVVLIVAFLGVESRHRDPTLPLRIFRSRSRSSAYLIALTHGGAAIGWQFVASLYMQRILGYSEVRTAFALLPIGVTIFVVAQFFTGPLVSKYGVRALCVTGTVLQAIGILLFAFVGVQDQYFAIILPSLVIHGAGLGMIFPSMNIAGISGVEERYQGVASGLIVATYAIGTGIGAALLATVVDLVLGDRTGNAALLDGYQTATVVGGLLAVCALLVSLFGLPRARKTEAVAAG